MIFETLILKKRFASMTSVLRIILWLFLSLFCCCVAGAFSHDYEAYKLDYYNRIIDKYEDLYNEIGRRLSITGKVYVPRVQFSVDHKSTEGIKRKLRVDTFGFVENCFVSAASRIYDSHTNKLIKVVEGPINLRKVEGVREVLYKPGTSIAWNLRFSSQGLQLPDLFFKSKQDLQKSLEIFRRIIPLCKERYRLHKILNPEPMRIIEELVVPEPDEPMNRLVRYRQDDTTLSAALLTNGLKAYSARLKTLKDLKTDQDKLRLQTLIFMADQAGTHLANELVERARKGVKIEIFIDALSSALDIRDLTIHKNTKKMYRNFMAAGIPVYGYRCKGHRLFDEVSLSRRYKKPIWDQRYHEKLWIVNNKLAIIGGMNIGNDYFRLNKQGFGYWRDQDILVRGKEIVQDMVNIFEGNVKSYLANYLDPRQDSCFNSYDPILQAEEYESFFLDHYKNYKIKRTRNSKKKFVAHARATIKKLQRDLENNAKSTQLSFEFLNAARVVHNRPKLGELHIEKVYLDMINNSKFEILIENAYFIPSIQIRKALRRAAKRGVKIVVLTNAYAVNDVPPTTLLSRHLYKELVDYNYNYPGYAGNAKEIEIWEWTGDSTHDGKLEQGMNHAKFMVVDRKLVFIGSYNLDPRSRNINSEVGLIFAGKSDKLAKEIVKEYYETDLRFAKKVPYYLMVSYRKPIGFFKAIYLKSTGYNTDDNSLSQISKESFFRMIAKINEDTW